jgi:hypothetical protein
MQGAFKLRGQPLGAMVAMAIVKMIIMPVIGVFFIWRQPHIYPRQDHSKSQVGRADQCAHSSASCCRGRLQP